MIIVAIMSVIGLTIFPYAQLYIDESRTSRAKADLEEIKRALVRFELDRITLYSKTDQSDLLGSYLNKTLFDPWGAAYAINSASSTCYSHGPDGIPNNGDDVIAAFRSKMAATRIIWADINMSAVVDPGDGIDLYVTRPGFGAVVDRTGLTVGGNPLPLDGVWRGQEKRVARFLVSGFTPGITSFTIAPINGIVDQSQMVGSPATADALTIRAP